MFQFWFLVKGCIIFVFMHFMPIRVASRYRHVGGWLGRFR
jgi:hypothetical protein